MPQLARQLASIDQFANGRLCINIISSDIPGEELESSPRYQRTREWMQVLRQLLDGQSIDFHGEFVDLTLDPPRANTVSATCPPMYFGGFSLAAKDAAAEADVFVTWPDTVGNVALTAAVPVKLVRVLLLVPVLTVLARSSLASRREPESAVPGRLQHVRGLVPGFLALFILASIISSTGVIPDGLADLAADVEKILFTAALFAIGISVHAPTLRRIGMRPALTSAAIWAVAALTTLVILRA